MADDEEQDVKVFSTTADQEEQDAQDQLTEDKKDVVLEAEMEATPRPEDIGVKPGGAFKPMPSPSYFPLFMPQLTGIGSPNYNPFMQSMAGLMRTMSPAYGVPLLAMSPTYPTAINPMLFQGPGSPMFQVINHVMAKMEHSQMRATNPLAQMNTLTRMQPYNPMANVANGMPDQLRRPREGRVKKEEHIKKPLNAFMWFMKENRPKILNELGFKEKQSAELNKELGKRWQELGKEEQAKYFEMAKKDRDDHKAKFPNWSARENYAVHKKKKKRRDRTEETTETKKCRARFGTERQDLWCKYCKRKKKCEWATVAAEGAVDAQDRSMFPDYTSEQARLSVSASSSSGPSPLASSSSMGGPSPLGPSHEDSDTDETDDLDAEMAEEDDEDTTLTQQALQDVVKPEPR